MAVLPTHCVAHKALHFTKRGLEPPPATIMDMVRGSWRAEILHTMAVLDIPSILGKAGPLTAQQLAKMLGVNEERLYRVLRAAVQTGLFTVLPAKAPNTAVRFKNNCRSAVLREGHPNCLKNMVMHFTTQTRPAMDDLVWSLRTGGVAFEHTHNGMSVFEWLKADPAQEKIFSRAMKEVDSPGAHVVVTDYDWNQYARVIDIAGAYGSFLASILAKHRAPRGVLFDQAQVIERAEGVWAEDAKLGALRKRIDFAKGDFFNAETLPDAKDGDLYLLRLILHDWSDEDSVAILSNVRKAIGTAKAKLVIVETTLRDEFDDPLFARALFDMHMMVAFNAQERTCAEWKALLRAAGFKMTRDIPTRGGFSVVEAEPVTEGKEANVELV